MNYENLIWSKLNITALPVHSSVFFSLFFSSPTLTFLQEGVIVGFRNFAWGFKSHKKNKICGENKFYPRRVDFLGGFFREKKRNT